MIGSAYGLLWLALLIYILYIRTGKRALGWAGTGCLIASWVLLTSGLVQRGLKAGHWPLANRFEFALCFLWAMLAVYLLLEASWRRQEAGPFVTALALLVGTYALTRPASDQVIAPLLPALRSMWLQLHVLSAAIGYGVSGVAAGLALMRLAAPALSKEAEGQGKLPALTEIERAMERLLALGFPWLTLGILSGAIWAQQAWGRYWGWDPKEDWSLATWLWYLLILHVRSLRGWRGTRLAILVVIGFGLVIFTFIGVPWLVRTVRLESLHGF